MNCIPTLFLRLSEVPKPTLQRLQVFSTRTHVHAFLSLAPSPSLALIHSYPSSSCSLSHVLFQSLFLSLTKVSIHSLFPSCKFVSCPSLPLSPPTCTPTCTGCFKCLLPLGVVPGQTMEVAVPAGYPQAGRISRFVVSSLQEPLSHISHHETLLENARV